MTLVEAKEVLSKNLGQSPRTKKLVSLFESNGKSGCVVLPSSKQREQYFKVLLASLSMEANEVLSACEGDLYIETTTSYSLVDAVDCYTVLRGPRTFLWRKTLSEMAWSYPAPTQTFDFLCRYDNYIWSNQSPREVLHHFRRFLEHSLQNEIIRQKLDSLWPHRS